MRALIVGYGSIGSRHAAILQERGCDVAVVSSRHVADHVSWTTLTQALRDFSPDYVVIATPTYQHYDDISILTANNFYGDVLVEKPLFHNVSPLPKHAFRSASVGYNLRFHPLLQKIKQLLSDEQILAIQGYAGQFLPSWRPERDYADSYSASRDKGGGVLRDLSHELDYLTWLAGRWKRVVAVGGHYSDLRIDSDDIYTIIMETERCPTVSLQINYLDRICQRAFTVNTASRTISVDLLAGTISINGVIENNPTERNDTYKRMHNAIINHYFGTVCSYDEGFDVVRLIDSIELSGRTGQWIKR